MSAHDESPDQNARRRAAHTAPALTGAGRIAAAENPRTEPALLERLASDPNVEVRWRVARNPGTPFTALVSMTGDHPRVMMELANRSIDLEQALALAKSGAVALLAALAKRADCPVTELTSLSTHPAVEVRSRVAGNRATPRDVLARMVTSQEPNVVDELLANPRVPAELVDELAVRASDPALHKLCSLSGTRPQTLLRLLQCGRGTEHALRAWRRRKLPIEELPVSVLRPSPPCSLPPQLMLWHAYVRGRVAGSSGDAETFERLAEEWGGSAASLIDFLASIR